MQQKQIAILGSTGSIGKQALTVISKMSDMLSLYAITANNQVDLLIEQARLFRPKQVVIANPAHYHKLKTALGDLNIQISTGAEAIIEVVKSDEIDIVLTAMVGYSGLKPTIAAIEHGKDIALANKETLVVAGDIITQLAKKHNVKLLPVDSEHSAIFQCLEGEDNASVEKIYLTASGGPFRNMSSSQLNQVSLKDALKHPNWEMGAKITIDSASMMNKGLEAIEARWLFNLAPEQIDVIIHPQSVIHSIVQFSDGSMKAQMGLPDMKLPIIYAINYPVRVKSDFQRFNFMDYPKLTFEKPRSDVFRNLELAYNAMHQGGNAPCVLNAANEIAVDAFIKQKIKFVQLPEVVENALTNMQFIKNPSLDDLIQTHNVTSKHALEYVS